MIEVARHEECCLLTRCLNFLFKVVFAWFGHFMGRWRGNWIESRQTRTKACKDEIFAELRSTSSPGSHAIEHPMNNPISLQPSSAVVFLHPGKFNHHSKGSTAFNRPELFFFSPPAHCTHETWKSLELARRVCSVDRQFWPKILAGKVSRASCTLSIFLHFPTLPPPARQKQQNQIHCEPNSSIFYFHII